MKYNTLFVLVAVCSALSILSCKKENKRDAFISTYNQLTGTAKYVYDAGGVNLVHYGYDTASLTISKNSDKPDYINLNGVGVDESTADLSFKFVKSGAPVLAKVVDTGFVIEHQLPFEGSGMSIDGSGSIKNGKLQISYHTYYRGSEKYSTVTQQ